MIYPNDKLGQRGIYHMFHICSQKNATTMSATQQKTNIASKDF